MKLGKDDWEGAAHYLSEAARSIQSAGADFLLICTNTMHKIAPQIGMLLNQHDTAVKLYDTTALHAKNAVEFAL